MMLSAGHIRVVEYLLQCPGVNPADLSSWALRKAAQNGHTSVVKALIDDGRSDLTAHGNLALNFAVKGGHHDIVHLLLESPAVRDAAKDGVALGFAASNGDLDLVELFLTGIPCINASERDNWAFVNAAANGYTRVCRRLLQEPGVSVAGQRHNAIVYAAMYNHYESVLRAGIVYVALFLIMTLRTLRFLLDCPGADPGAQQGAALCWSASNGHTRIVRLLVEDGRVPVNSRDGAPLIRAAENGHLETCKVLLEAGADPGLRESESLIFAVKYGHVDVVVLLAEHEAVDASAQNCKALMTAASQGNLRILEALASRNDTGIRSRGSKALAIAASRGSVGIVDYLLRNADVDPCDGDGLALSWATLEEHAPVVHRLVRDSRVVEFVVRSGCHRTSALIAQAMKQVSDECREAISVAFAIRDYRSSISLPGDCQNLILEFAFGDFLPNAATIDCIYKRIKEKSQRRLVHT
ncbi:hypothetical protein PBRA_005885 [Plasmodiophora brassicae]|uniref:Uncharacterized protein n=1 Tax=Plasmodiophora brassicae TaxID=37360 RepID=A0A0G4IRP9_PLABS|nr:hypothetical protein PBRA_005885 [Plasmodiophora brassicae]